MTSRPDSWQHQLRALEFIKPKPGAMLTMEMGTGKDLANDTPMPTPAGWTTMGALQTGDTVFDEQGYPCTVTGVHPQGQQPTICLTFTDRARLWAGTGHLWATLTPDDLAQLAQGAPQPRDWAQDVTPRTTSDVARTLATTAPDGANQHLHSIPLNMPLLLPDIYLPVDPYHMGQAALPTEGRQAMDIQTILRAGTSQRARALTGILEAQAHILPQGKLLLQTQDPRAARHVTELARSLGHQATLGGPGPHPSSTGEHQAALTITPSTNPYLDPERRRALDHAARQHRPHDPWPQLPLRSVADALESSPRQTTCITVDSPSRLFLAGEDMVPTHNSRVAIDLMVHLQASRILIIAPLSVVDYVWPQQIAIHAPDQRFQVIPLGSRVPGVQTKARNAGLYLDPHRNPFPTILVVNYESAWREPLGTILMKQNWDLVVYDEVHRLKTHDGKASQWAARLSGRAARRLGLSGTPMPNSPLDLFGQFRAIDRRLFGNSYHQFRNRYAVLEETNIPVRPRRRRPNQRQQPPKTQQMVTRIVDYQNQDELHNKFYSLAFHVSAAETLDLPPILATQTVVALSRKGARVYTQMEKDFVADLENGQIATADNALSRLLRLQQVTSGYAPSENGDIVQVDESKENVLGDILQDLGPDESTVVFARFRPDLESIQRAAAKKGRPCFELSGRVKQIPQWEQHGGVLAAQIQAGSSGIDLTKARYAIYYSMGFSLGDYQQSMARIHRPGQDRSVRYIHIIAADTVDEQLMRALDRKENLVHSILQARALSRAPVPGD